MCSKSLVKPPVYAPFHFFDCTVGPLCAFGSSFFISNRALVAALSPRAKPRRLASSSIKARSQAIFLKFPVHAFERPFCLCCSILRNENKHSFCFTLLICGRTDNQSSELTPLLSVTNIHTYLLDVVRLG